MKVTRFDIQQNKVLIEYDGEVFIASASSLEEYLREKDFRRWLDFVSDVEVAESGGEVEFYWHLFTPHITKKLLTDYLKWKLRK